MFIEFKIGAQILHVQVAFELIGKLVDNEKAREDSRIEKLRLQMSNLSLGPDSLLHQTQLDKSDVKMLSVEEIKEEEKKEEQEPSEIQKAENGLNDTEIDHLQLLLHDIDLDDDGSDGQCSQDLDEREEPDQPVIVDPAQPEQINTMAQPVKDLSEKEKKDALIDAYTHILKSLEDINIAMPKPESNHYKKLPEGELMCTKNDLYKEYEMLEKHGIPINSADISLETTMRWELRMDHYRETLKRGYGSFKAIFKSVIEQEYKFAHRMAQQRILKKLNVCNKVIKPNNKKRPCSDPLPPITQSKRKPRNDCIYPGFDDSDSN